MKTNKMNLQLFNDSEFFKNAFDEVYNIEDNGNNIDIPENAPETPVSDNNEETIETSNEVEETVTEPSDEVKSDTLTREELLEALKSMNNPQEVEIDEETQQALELMNYLKANPNIIQAMSEVDPQAHQTLNSYVPNELSKKLEEIENFMVEQKYQSYVSEMKNKYEDYDADKVLEFAEKHDITNLEVAYKALKAESTPSFDEKAYRAKLEKEIREQIMKEQNQIANDTQTIIGTQGDVPQVKKEVSLTLAEKRVAQGLGMSFEEYASVRDNR